MKKMTTKNLPKLKPVSFETLRATIYENDRFIKEKFAETDRLFKETREDMKETDRRMKELQQTVGGWSNNHGSFAEEYFYNSFEKGKHNFFGEKFDEIEKNVKGIEKGFKDEYDILLINGKSLGIIEVKFKVREKDIVKVLRKAETIKINFPKFNSHQVYLGLATLIFDPEIEQECINQGIAVIKQVGDSVVINDAHLKIF